MVSDSEHTNRLCPPQQAQGRKWPIVSLLLGLTALALVLTDCGGSSSTSAPTATTGSASPPTSEDTASTPTPQPTTAAAVGASAGTTPETQEYLRAYIKAGCAISTGPVPTTWGEQVDRTKANMVFIEENEPPEELRDFFEAQMAGHQMVVRFGEERRSAPLTQEAWSEFTYGDPERTKASEALQDAYERLDDAVKNAMLADC